MRRTLYLVSVLFAAGCAADPLAAPAPAVRVWLDPARDPDGPFPSDFYARPDPGTATGVRPDFSRAKAASLPMRALRIFDTDTLHVHQNDVESLDGFSGFAPVFVPFSGALAPASVKPAAFVLVDLASGVTVPVAPKYFGGFGAWVALYPQKVLRARARHVVLVRDTLRDLGGAALLPAGEWPLGAEERAAAVKLAGVPADALLGGFAFTVEDTTGESIAAAEKVFADPAPAPFDIVRVDARTITGKFVAPSYRVNGIIPLTRSGAPAAVTTETLQFYLRLPKNYATAPRPYPLAIWGHGLQGDRESIPEVNDGAVVAIDAVEHGTRRTVASSDLVAFKFFDFFHLLNTRDNLRQTELDLVTLARMLSKLDPALQAALGGGPWLDVEPLGYIGGSLGAIVGGGAVPLVPSIGASVMVVGGAGLSQAFEWGLFGLLAPNVKFAHTPVEQAAFYALVQAIFDRADGVSYLRHAVREPLPGHDPQNMFFANVIGDPLVPNPANETYMWAAGLELLPPVYSNRYGLPVLPGPTARGNVVVNGVTRTAVAFEYNPGPEVTGIDRHGYMEDDDAAIRQIEHFFLTSLAEGYGEVIQAR
jgi:hypothetical protein